LAAQQRDISYQNPSVTLVIDSGLGLNGFSRHRNVLSNTKQGRIQGGFVGFGRTLPPETKMAEKKLIAFIRDKVSTF